MYLLQGSINSDDSNGGPDGIFKIPIRAGTLLHTNEVNYNNRY